jgi:hypothetical protein
MLDVRTRRPMRGGYRRRSTEFPLFWGDRKVYMSMPTVRPLAPGSWRIFAPGTIVEIAMLDRPSGGNP